MQCSSCRFRCLCRRVRLPLCSSLYRRSRRRRQSIFLLGMFYRRLGYDCRNERRAAAADNADGQMDALTDAPGTLEALDTHSCWTRGW